MKNEGEADAEIDLSNVALELITYSPKDDPTLRGISLEEYISRRIFSRSVAKDALEQLCANDSGQLNNVRGMEFNSGSFSYARGLA